ncbi:MAG: glycerophosphodiester phosphodiesterase family protein [Hyphomonadaceae bacterium]|nr:glycerophosphodiester phosphodiesterase family protein [Hyphomonadaceae bacterium]
MRALLVSCALALAACQQQDAASTATAADADAYALAPSNLPAFFDCLRERGQTVVAAHRGGPEPGFAENAIPTFENTLRQAPAMLEVDVRETRDGVLVLLHDEELDRTTTGEGLLSEATLAEVQALSLQDEAARTLDARVPTLREALDWAEGRAVLELDVKRGVAFEDVVEEVRAASAEHQVIFITYSVPAAIRVHRLAPAMMISASVNSESDIAELERARVDLTRILAWTGINEPNSALNTALAERGVEVLFGTLGGSDSWDDRFASSGDDQYAAFAETGLQLIATSRAAAAARDLDAADGAEGHGVMQCVGAE